MADELLIITEGYSEDSTIEEDILIVTEGFAENLPTASEIEDELEDIETALTNVNSNISSLSGLVSGGFVNLNTSVDSLRRLIMRMDDKLKLDDNKLRDIIGIIIEENRKTRTEFSREIKKVERMLPNRRLL